MTLAGNSFKYTDNIAMQWAEKFIHNTITFNL